MAQRGRKPKPTELKVLEGNPGKRTLNKNEPRPDKKAPRCPSWLEDEAKKEWKRMGKVLEQMGLLTDMDMAAFAGYCQAFARWKEAEEFLTQHGTIVRTTEWISPASTTGVHRTDKFKNYAKVL
ncbi:MAG: phage terminase small subunit P27 family [Anaerovoracaceae bacterium]